MPTDTLPKYKSPRDQRPHCPVHGCLMRVESSRGPIAYSYCPRQGCSHRAKLVRSPVKPNAEER
jgi:hypothetical protein